MDGEFYELNYVSMKGVWYVVLEKNKYWIQNVTVNVIKKKYK